MSSEPSKFCFKFCSKLLHSFQTLLPLPTALITSFLLLQTPSCSGNS